MLKMERQDKILSLLSQNDLLTTSHIAEQLNVSGMTIRRDIQELYEQNKLLRIYGGIQRVNNKDREFSTNEKLNNFIKEKKHIGKVMNSLIKDNDVVYLGAGTTILHALKEVTKNNLFIITNSLLAFNYIIEETDYKVILTGGMFNTNTEEFYGPVAENSFNNLNINISFAATNGVYLDNITTSSDSMGGIQQVALNNSKIKVVVADHTKFNTSDIYTFYKLSDIDFLITDDSISQDIFNYYNQFTNIINHEVIL